MKVSFDPVKNAQNVELRGLSFERALEFEFETASIMVDGRRDYGETRYQAVGFLGERLHTLVFTETPAGVRVISFRKANQRERSYYEQTKTKS